MGCCLSEEVKQHEDGETKPKYSWEREERVDRSLLMVCKQEGGVVTRLPGQLNGKQFIAQECTQTTILVLDHTETVTIDRCTDCQIIVAPCRTSVFLRDCSNCVCVVACQQLRTRDCKKCTLSLLSTTPPVIEASSKMTFSCYQCSYPQLRGLFDSAGLSVFNNSWSTIHDFTGGTGGGNWSIASGDNPVRIDLPAEVADVGVSFSAEDSIVPLTVGPKQRPPDECCLVVFFDTEESDAPVVRFVSALRGKMTLVHTKRVQLASHEAERVFPSNQELASRSSKGRVIFLEVAGSDCSQLCAQATGSLGDSAYVSPTVEQGKADVDAFISYLETNVGM